MSPFFKDRMVKTPYPPLGIDDGAKYKLHGFSSLTLVVLSFLALLVVVSLSSSWGAVVVVIDGWFFSIDNIPFSAMILVEPWTSNTPCSKKACRNNATCKKRTDMGTGLRLGNDYCFRTRN
jgi:hypothetical protein